MWREGGGREERPGQGGLAGRVEAEITAGIWPGGVAAAWSHGPTEGGRGGREEGRRRCPPEVLVLRPAWPEPSSWSMGWLEREYTLISATRTGASFTLLWRPRICPPSVGCCITWAEEDRENDARYRLGME